MYFSLRSVVGFTEPLQQDNHEIVNFLFTPIRPWEENMLVPEPVPVTGFQRPDILKTIRYLKA